MSLKEFKSGMIVTGIICLCTGLFSMAHYMGWLEQDTIVTKYRALCRELNNYMLSRNETPIEKK